MKISTRKNTWISVGCGIALLAGAPAMADDTELLLISPDPRFNPKPNVMFVMDTSGSMGTMEQTIQPLLAGSTLIDVRSDSFLRAAQKLRQLFVNRAT